MSEKKQTALQWLNDELKKKYDIELSADSEVFDKALQIEREQKEYDYSCGVIHAIKNPDKIDCKQYYTDTYGE